MERRRQRHIVWIERREGEDDFDPHRIGGCLIAFVKVLMPRNGMHGGLVSVS